MTRVRAQRGVLEVAGGASPREVSWIAAKKIGDTWGWDTLRAFQQREYENLRKLGQGSAGP